MTGSKWKRGILAAVVLFVGACEAGVTGPTPDAALDTDGALADLDALQAVLGSDDLSAFRALDGRTPFSGGTPVASALRAMEPSGDGPGARAFVLGLARGLEAPSGETDGATAGPIISGWHRGTTFVYDPAEDRYRADLDRPGAPETGVRFVLYDVDATGVPVPEKEIGYADLVDEGDGSAEDLALRLLVVVRDETLLDYRTTLDHDARGGAVTVDGFLVGDGVRLDFDVAIAAENVDGATRLDIEFDLGIEARDFVVHGEIQGMEDDEEEGAGRILIDLRHGTDRLTVDVSGADGMLEGSVSLAGSPFALIRGPKDDPEITDPDGQPLTLGETLLLLRVLDVVEDVFDLLEDILDPVDELVLLGFVL